jgi:hypothetical protein
MMQQQQQQLTGGWLPQPVCASTHPIELPIAILIEQGEAEAKPIPDVSIEIQSHGRKQVQQGHLAIANKRDHG